MKKEAPTEDSLNDEDEDKPRDAAADTELAEIYELHRLRAEASRKEQESLQFQIDIKEAMRSRVGTKQARGARGTTVSPSQQPPANKRPKFQEGTIESCWLFTMSQIEIDVTLGYSSSFQVRVRLRPVRIGPRVTLRTPG